MLLPKAVSLITAIVNIKCRAAVELSVTKHVIHTFDVNIKYEKVWTNNDWHNTLSHAQSKRNGPALAIPQSRTGGPVRLGLSNILVLCHKFSV